MRRRLQAGKPATVAFTCDYHEIVGGDLRPGGALLLRYDPHRIVPSAEPYRFGDPDRPVSVYVQFRDGAAPIRMPLGSPAGIIPCPDVDLTGQGSMLSAQVQVPEDAERLVVWFSYPTASGMILYDSNYGANYWFGFPCREIEVVRATVMRRPDVPVERFDLTVSAMDAVEQVTVRFFLTTDPTCTKHEMWLQRVGEAAALELPALWTCAVDVPHGAIVRFKVCYWICGQRLTDDNADTYYLAPEPEPERVPQPPQGLLDAATAWR